MLVNAVLQILRGIRLFEGDVLLRLPDYVEMPLPYGNGLLSGIGDSVLPFLDLVVGAGLQVLPGLQVHPDNVAGSVIRHRLLETEVESIGRHLYPRNLIVMARSILLGFIVFRCQHRGDGSVKVPLIRIGSIPVGAYDPTVHRGLIQIRPHGEPLWRISTVHLGLITVVMTLWILLGDLLGVVFSRILSWRPRYKRGINVHGALPSGYRPL